jgi:hypothetical protein
VSKKLDAAARRDNIDTWFAKFWSKIRAAQFPLPAKSIESISVGRAVRPICPPHEAIPIHLKSAIQYAKQLLVVGIETSNTFCQLLCRHRATV